MTTKIRINPNESFISGNYEKALKLARVDSNLTTLLENLGERYAICPASSRRDYFSCFPGGLVYHSLFVRFWLKKTLEGIPHEFSERTINVVSLLHDIGKVGTMKEDYYIRSSDDWQDRKGWYYETNPKIQYMKIPYRSLFLAQQYKIELTQDEFLAILLGNGQVTDSLTGNDPRLASVLRFSAQWAMKTERDFNEVLWPK